MSNQGTEKRGRGRPSVGSTPINLRLAPDQLAALDAWIELQHDKPSRPEAARQLMNAGLAAFVESRSQLTPSERIIAAQIPSLDDGSADKEAIERIRAVVDASRVVPLEDMQAMLSLLAKPATEKGRGTA